MVFRKATARLAGERQHPATASHPQHKAGDGARGFCTSPTAKPHHPCRNNPPARRAVLCCCAKADSLPGLARGRAVGMPPEITRSHGVTGPAPLVQVEGCGVTEVVGIWERR